MQLRVSTSLRYFSLVLICLSAVSRSFGESSLIKTAEVRTVYKNIDETSKMSTYPKWIYNWMKSHQGWSPLKQISDSCQKNLSSSILQPDVCVAQSELNPWQNFLSKIYVDFNFENSKWFQRVQFEPQPNVKFRGLLGLQPDHEKNKKPLVILRMGIHGNIDEFLAERFIAKIIYEDLGYNLLVLESLTSHGYLTINDRFSFGGIEEGLHTFYVLQLIRLQKLDWAKDISKIYLTGISLGGPGVFVTNYLDEQSKMSGVKKKSIDAIELFCPLVNLEQTFNEHARQGLLSAIIDLWNARRLLALRLKNEEFANIPWWKTFFDLRPRFVPSVLSWLNAHEPKPVIDINEFQKQFPDLELPQEFVQHVQASRTYYELNRFWGFYKNESTPISIYLTPNDPAVKNNLNSDLIRIGKQPGEFQKVTFTDLEGLHCAVAAEYQWPFLVELMKRGFDR